MKKLLLIGCGLFVLPLVAFGAYDDVSLAVGSEVTVGSDTVVIYAETGLVQQIEVGSSNFTVTLASTSAVTFKSSSGKTLSATGASSIASNFSCEGGMSFLSLTNTTSLTAVTVTVTIGSACSSGSTSSGGGSTSGGGTVIASSGGGGGGSSSLAPVATVKAPAAAVSSGAAAIQAQIDALLAQIKTLQAGGSSVGAYVSGTFARALRQGTSHADVKRLQQVLNNDPDTRIASLGVGAPGKETNYFGALTKKAVQKFQQKHGIAKPGDPGYGDVGPKTRAKLNSL